MKKARTIQLPSTCSSLGLALSSADTFLGCTSVTWLETFYNLHNIISVSYAMYLQQVKHKRRKRHWGTGYIKITILESIRTRPHHNLIWNWWLKSQKNIFVSSIHETETIVITMPLFPMFTYRYWPTELNYMEFE